MTFEQFKLKVNEAFLSGVFIQNQAELDDILCNANPLDFETEEEYNNRIQAEQNNKKLAELYGTTHVHKWDRRKLYKKIKTIKELTAEKKLIGETFLYFKDQSKNAKKLDHKEYAKERMIYYLKWIDDIEKEIRLRKSKKVLNGDIETKIKIAKDYPVENIIEFNRAGKAHCLWHSEKTPSLHLNKKDNTVHCYGCGKHTDSIGVAQEYYKCGFLEAVVKLTS